MHVWKFKRVHGTCPQRVRMPKGARLLTVQRQRTQPVVWALRDETEPMVERQVCGYGTGDAMLRAWPYVATLPNGSAVVHVFDLGEA